MYISKSAFWITITILLVVLLLLGIFSYITSFELSTTRGTLSETQNTLKASEYDSIAVRNQLEAVQKEIVYFKSDDGNRY
jgi:hypothetical protein